MRIYSSSLRARLALMGAVCAFAASAQAAPGKAKIKKECADAYVQAQKLKKDGALTKAREQLITCARDTCMSAVKKDCLLWLDEVNEAIPSVVVEAHDASGNETLDVKVSVDGEVVAETLSTKGIEVNPGTHQFRFEMDGEDPIEQEVIIRAGQKNKLLKVSFGKEEASGPAPIETEPAAAPIVEDHPEKKGPPVASYVLGGIGIVALAGAGYFWLGAEGDKSDLEDSGCSPNCDSGDVDSIKSKRLYGDIALGVGVVSLGVATYLWLSPSKADKKPPRDEARVDVQLLPGGAFGGVSGRF